MSQIIQQKFLQLFLRLHRSTEVSCTLFFPPSPVVVNGILDFKRGRRKSTIYYVPAEMDKEAREKKDRRKTERKRDGKTRDVSVSFFSHNGIGKKRFGLIYAFNASVYLIPCV